MSIESEIARIRAARDDIAAACEEQGVDAAGASLAMLADKVRTIGRGRTGFDLTDVVLIGDSYLQGYLADGGANWGDYLIDYLGLTSVRKYAYGGIGYVNTSNTEQLTFAQAVTGPITAAEPAPEKTTLVLIMGGVNDGGYTVGDITTGASDFLAAAHTLWPNAMVVGVISPWVKVVRRAVYDGIAAGFLYSRKTSMCKLSYSWMVGAVSRYASDLLHPTAEGHQQIALHLKDYLLTGQDLGVPRLVQVYSDWLQGYVNIRLWGDTVTLSIMTASTQKASAAANNYDLIAPDWLLPRHELFAGTVYADGKVGSVWGVGGKLKLFFFTGITGASAVKGTVTLSLLNDFS